MGGNMNKTGNKTEKLRGKIFKCVMGNRLGYMLVDQILIACKDNGLMFVTYPKQGDDLTGATIAWREEIEI